MKFRKQYQDPEGDQYLGIVSSLACDPEDDVAEQHHKDETDISVMLARMGVSPERDLPVVTISDVVRDVSLLPDTLQEAYDVIEAGHAAFANLPHGVREYFRNDPRRFVTASEDELIASGIPGRKKSASPAEESEAPKPKKAAKKAAAESPPEDGDDS